MLCIGVAEMPITRQLIKLGNSKVIAIPLSWIRYVEKETGQPLKTVGLDVSDTIKIYPVFEKKANGASKR
jgi:hypothetical protein